MFVQSSRLRRSGSVLALALLTLAPGACQLAGAQSQFVRFQARTLDAEFSGGYGVDLADIDADGSRDVIAVALNPARLAWYDNGEWQRHLIDTQRESLIDVAPRDITGNGVVDLVLASEFSLGDTSSGGRIQWLENPRGASEADQWQAHDIDRLPASHRLRWARVSESGAEALINLPIVGEGATAPEFAAGAELTAYNIPEEPRDPWGKVVLDDSLEMAHALEIVDWNGDGRDELLTGSFNGVDLFRLAAGGRFVDRQTLVESQDGERPQIGASEVAVGEHPREQRFLATIEPWHGNEVVVYRRDGDSDEWLRRVIDDTLSDGHALAVADLNNDGWDEIIAGGRGEPWALNVYRYLDAEDRWRRIRLDDQVAVSGLFVADLTGNDFSDIVAVGSDSGNLRLYRNQGR